MNTHKVLLLLTLAPLLLANECKKEDLDKLPPETQEGKNTFGCLINGEVFVKGKAPWMHSQISAGYSRGDKSLNISVYLHPYGYIYMDSFVLNINEQTSISICYYSPRNCRSHLIRYMF